MVGDVFQLGPHRFICGDATDPAVLAELMEGDVPARLILTDEPYNVKGEDQRWHGQPLSLAA